MNFCLFDIIDYLLKEIFWGINLAPNLGARGQLLSDPVATPLTRTNRINSLAGFAMATITRRLKHSFNASTINLYFGLQIARLILPRTPLGGQTTLFKL